MLPVVLTSLNPASRLPYQIRCLQAWRRLGFDVLSLNLPEERAALIAAGAPREALLAIGPEQSGLAIHGRPMPRIRALLDIAATRRPGWAVLIVNSDLYPAAAESGFARDWLARAPMLALTRDEVPILEAASLAGRRPYRGGLDAFAINAGTVDRLREVLVRHEAADRMCFGIVGWDYFLAAVALSPDIGGSFLDSGLLLHEWHPATYSAIDEFGHYVPAMAAMGAVADAGPAVAAEEMAARIDRTCDDARAATDLIAALHFAAPDLPLALARGPVLPGARQIALRLRALVPWARWNYDFAALTALIARHLSGEPFDFARLFAFCRTGPGLDHQFAEALLAILLHFECTRETAPDGPALAGAASGGLRPLGGGYPPNQLHAQVVARIMRETEGAPALRRLEIVQLCGAELVDEAILNRRLVDWLALSCMNDGERAIMARIRAHLRAGTRRPAAPGLKERADAH